MMLGREDDRKRSRNGGEVLCRFRRKRSSLAWLAFFPLFAFGVHEPLYLATAKEFSTLDAAMVSSPSTPQNDIRIYIVSIELIAK